MTDEQLARAILEIKVMADSPFASQLLLTPDERAGRMARALGGISVLADNVIDALSERVKAAERNKGGAQHPQDRST